MQSSLSKSLRNSLLSHTPHHFIESSVKHAVSTPLHRTVSCLFLSVSVCPWPSVDVNSVRTGIYMDSKGNVLHDSQFQYKHQRLHVDHKRKHLHLSHFQLNEFFFHPRAIGVPILLRVWFDFGSAALGEKVRELMKSPHK